MPRARRARPGGASPSGPISSTSPSSCTTRPPWRASAVRAPAGPVSSAIFERVSASSALGASAVAPIRPLHTGSPLDGSSRWWAYVPSARRQIRTLRPDVATPPRAELQLVHALAAQRMLHIDRHGVHLRAHAAHRYVSAAVHHEARVRLQTEGDRVRGEALTRPAGVDEQAGRTADRPLRVVDRDVPPACLRAGPGGPPRWCARERLSQRRGCHVLQRALVARRGDLAGERRVDEAVRALRRPHARGDRCAEQDRGRHLLFARRVERAQLAVGTEARRAARRSPRCSVARARPPLRGRVQPMTALARRSAGRRCPSP